MNRMKVALITHFSSPLVRERLELHPAGRHYRYRDMAAWNVAIIDGLKGRDDVELYVISAHIGMKRTTQEFDIDGVRYYFFNPDFQYPWAYFDHFFFSQSNNNYPRNRRIVKSIISKIKPDIVNLIGAENIYYSITALDVKNIPVILQLQTVYANPDRYNKTGNVDKKRWDTEIELFRSTPYMTCAGRMYYDLVKEYNPEAIVFPRKWPVAPYPETPNVPKKYDFVYFARYLGKGKGFDNAVEAIGKFVRHHPNAKFLAIGSKGEEWSYFESRIKELGIEDKLEINPPIKEYTDLLIFVKQARFALLPVTLDVISGTILESMRMGMPVITCRTSGTPSLNEKRKTVLISEVGDSDALCTNMLKLYEDSKLQEELRSNALKYINELDEKNSHNADIMVNQFKAVLSHYQNGNTIPKKLLFDIEEYKDYRKI